MAEKKIRFYEILNTNDSINLQNQVNSFLEKYHEYDAKIEGGIMIVRNNVDPSIYSTWYHQAVSRLRIKEE